MNVGPYMAYIFIYVFYPLYKKGGLGVQQILHKFLAVFGHFGYQNGCFLKL